MGLTRGSRGESIFDHGIATAKLNKSMREWSRRHLSFNSDWASRFRSRSPTPQPTVRSSDVDKGGLYLYLTSHTERTHILVDKWAFPMSRSGPPLTLRTPITADQIRRTRDIHTSASDRRPISANFASPGKRSLTPTALRTPRHLRPVIPTGSHNSSPLHRAKSQGAAGGSQPFIGIGPVPRSAKKWAKSSHLHEVRGRDERSNITSTSRGEDRRGRENEFSDVFRSPVSPFKSYSSNQHVTVGDNFDKGKSPHGRQPLSSLSTRRHSLDTDDSEIWVDTDVDGSEYEHSESDALSMKSALEI